MGLRDFFKKLGGQSDKEKPVDTVANENGSQESAAPVDADTPDEPTQTEQDSRSSKESEADEPHADVHSFDEASVAVDCDATAADGAETPEASDTLDERETTAFAAATPAVPETAPPPTKGFFAKLTEGLTKTRDNIGSLFESVFSGNALDEDFYDELEEALIIADIGARTTNEILTRLRSAVKEEKLSQPDQARDALRRVVVDIMRADTPFIGDEKAVVLIVGVNGVGKTTSIGKLAHYYKSQGKQVVLAAADTFRAAATEQLVEWGKRADVPVVKQGEGSDPAAVVFDAIASAKAKSRDMLICDTAGRLHNKKNLMEELAKIGRVIAREYPEARVETLLVLDATTGQNAVSQANVFAESVPLTGIVLTKLDGTAKGGVVIAIKQDTGIPVRFVGVGEALDDLQPFNPEDFAKALF